MDKNSSDMTPPAIILVGAQLGENIGTVARAMLNFGLTDLRLVNPRPGWQMERARKAASGAESLIDNHRLFDNVADATADIGYLVATTARLRDMVKPVLTPGRVAEEIRARASLSDTAEQVPGGILFGPERTGLTNEDISLADAICRVPLNPEFSSLNLAQAVLLLGYEWFQAGDDTQASSSPMPDTRPATRGEIHAMFAHFEAALDGGGISCPAGEKTSHGAQFTQYVPPRRSYRTGCADISRRDKCAAQMAARGGGCSAETARGSHITRLGRPWRDGVSASK